MTFAVYAWIASFAFGFVSIIGKLTNKYAIPNVWLFNFLWMLFSLLITIPVAFLNGATLPTHWPSLILVSIFNAVFGILYILSLSLLDISVLIPLMNLRTAFVAIFSAIFLGEILMLYQYLLIALIFIGGLFVSVDEKLSIRSFFRWPIFVGILCTLSYTFYGISINWSIGKNGYWGVTLWMAALSQIMLLLTYPFFKKDIGKLNLKQIISVFAMSIMLAIGIFTENRAYQDNVTITSIITALPLSMVLAFLLSYFAPKLLEKHTFKVYAIRFTAAAVMIICALKLSL
ncbi:MAG: hypothetical protein UV73_C0004G0102 [Candidatus Gottesmanbacteria bacterium GW2011_GWA2_43_14]|uniref:EamA domain-containing protein n=1 Tax=Candidatus Gottesmanbacteria bacterium GW2011_GWA2_43_14 TaxID=1618443 RepID=A0A0G1DJA7_9BACT|nr:MAG: hypothetical protein UV73_C0004G0102 [Candidatus Gottesmanbacteria bacterium GW2011_GWA2_43_14]